MIIKRFLIISIILWSAVCLAGPTGDMIKADSSSGGGGFVGGCYIYVGYGNTDGTPDTPAVGFTNYENVADREYGRSYEMTQEGIVRQINVRYGGNVSPDTYGTWHYVYNGTDKIGQYEDASPSASTWSGYHDVTVYGAQSLSVNSPDVLHFGLAFDGDGSNPTGTCFDEDVAGTIEYKDGAVGATGPPESVTFSTSLTSGSLAAILKIEVNCP